MKNEKYHSISIFSGFRVGRRQVLLGKVGQHRILGLNQKTFILNLCLLAVNKL